MIKNQEEWISVMRNASLLPDPPVRQKDGRWEVAQRKEAWNAFGPRVFDEHLDRIKAVAVATLRERHPKFELQPDDQFTADWYGKELKHSHALRKGLAESLALLGTSADALTSCSHGKADLTAILAVHEIFNNADWVLWASLNNYLPILAEAAPNEFLNNVERALEKQPCPFVDIFRQEVGGVMGQNFMTGLLWALETLAWSQEHLQRVTILLGDLAAIDPGGNWANRPANSLTEIFLPWMPQTCAAIPKRKAAVAALLKEHSEIGWKLLISLMPNTHSSSSGTHKPTWRKFIPDDWSGKVTNQEYWEQVRGYSELAVAEAVKDFSKLSKLIDVLPNLPNPAYTQTLEHLGSDAVLSKPESERLPLWEALVELAGKHRNFPEAQWVMPTEAIAKIEATAAKLAPQSLQLLYHRLFSDSDFNLRERTGSFEEQEKELSLRRQRAVLELLSAGKLDGLLDFARQVMSPGTVGVALGSADGGADDSELIPKFLCIEDKVLQEFISNFVWGRFWSKGWGWAENVNMETWKNEQKVAFFNFLPFNQETWQRATAKLGDAMGDYWKVVNVRPYGPQPHLIEAVEKLLQHARPRAAIRCIGRLIHEKSDFPTEIAVRALLNCLNSTEPLIGLDQHTLIEMIKWLQSNPKTDPDSLFQIEWAYLSLLDHYFGATPVILETRLATVPAFFCEVISIVFRSEKEESGERQRTDEEKSVALNAYRLLHGWQTAPGCAQSGAFDSNAFKKWLEEVSLKTKESGHYKIAMNQIGQVLPHTPPDPDGLWIPHSVAEALNLRDAGEMRSGFTCKLFNMRGVHGFSSGKEEREIAASFYEKADKLEDKGYQRIATSIRELGKGYERDAEREEKSDPFSAS